MMNRRVLLHDDNALTPTTGGYFKHTLPKALSTIVTTRNPALKNAITGMPVDRKWLHEIQQHRRKKVKTKRLLNKLNCL